jgi:steroid delta-isomerase-like uncharacterized protein
MSNKVLDEYEAAWSSGNPQRLAALCSDDCLYEDIPLGAVNRGPDEVAAFAAVAMEAFPDFRLELLARIAGETWAAAEWRVTGTHEGDLPSMPRTGKRFDFRGASIFELEGDKIKRCSDFWDMADLRRQLGLDPS